MATSSVAVTGTDTLAVKSETETYRVYVKLDEAGKIIEKELRVGTAGKDNAWWTAMDADPTYTCGLEQTVRLYKAGSLEGFQQIVTDPEEQLNVVNRGITQKTGQKLTAKLKELTADGVNLAFEVTGDVYDTLDLLNEETKRRNLSPVDKAIRAISQAFETMFPNDTPEERLARVRAVMPSV